MNIAQNWRLNGQRYALQGIKCESCGTVHATLREICPVCAAQEQAAYTFEKPVAIQFPVVHELRQAAR